jgi:hypothetical protein
VSARCGRERLGGEGRPGGDDERLVVRPTVAGDRAALEAMFQRCSPATVFRRFHGQVRAFPRAYLDEALSGTDAHYAVVCYSGCEAVALASCRTDEPGSEQDWIINMLARHGTWTSAFARGVRDVTLELATAETEVAPAAEAPAAEAPAAEAPGGSGGRTRDRLSSGILCEGEHDQRVTAAGWLARIPGDWLSGRALP